jgi:hypothetical protein
VSGLGQPPFDPRMMVALLLHGYASGLYSSRRIAKACREWNDFDTGGIVRMFKCQCGEQTWTETKD